MSLPLRVPILKNLLSLKIVKIRRFFFVQYFCYRVQEDTDSHLHGDTLLLIGGYVLVLSYMSLVLGNVTRMNIKVHIIYRLEFIIRK